jgi:hypothetical protein
MTTESKIRLPDAFDLPAPAPIGPELVGARTATEEAVEQARTLIARLEEARDVEARAEEELRAPPDGDEAQALAFVLERQKVRDEARALQVVLAARIRSKVAEVHALAAQVDGLEADAAAAWNATFEGGYVKACEARDAAQAKLDAMDARLVELSFGAAGRAHQAFRDAFGDWTVGRAGTMARSEARDVEARLEGRKRPSRLPEVDSRPGRVVVPEELLASPRPISDAEADHLAGKDNALPPRGLPSTGDSYEDYEADPVTGAIRRRWRLSQLKGPPSFGRTTFGKN